MNTEKYLQLEKTKEKAAILLQVAQEVAEKITLTIHTEGAGVAGIYTYEIAEQKVIEATNASRNHGFPLQIKMEQE